MCSYNRVNGEYASQNRWLLTEVLRGEWGFDGVVVSDWGAVHDRVAALAAGLDLEMPPNRRRQRRAIVAAVRDGRLDESVLDQAVGRVLRLIEQTRQRQPATQRRRGASRSGPAGRRGVHGAAQERWRRPAVAADAPGLSVAVIGEFARTPRYQGAGSSQVNPTRLDVPLDELAGGPSAATVRFAAGLHRRRRPRDGEDLVGRGRRAVPRGADVVVAFLGLPAAVESEGFDRTHIDLPKAQTDLIHALAEAVPATTDRGRPGQWVGRRDERLGPARRGRPRVLAGRPGHGGGGQRRPHSGRSTRRAG